MSLQENNNDPKVLMQDLSQKQEQGLVFVMQLFMKEKCPMPDKKLMTDIMNKHIGNTECFCHDENAAGFSVNKYDVEFKEGKMPPQLFVTECAPTGGFKLNEIEQSQLWDCPESDKIFKNCKYQVIATDMLAGGMDYKDRADMLMDYMEALLEIYPQCEAIYFQNSGKMFSRKKIKSLSVPRDKRFVTFAVNVRFFNIQDTDDMMIDTIGMKTLFMPDLQYHFHGLDPNLIVNHAYILLSYIYENACPIKNGETVDGINNAHIDPSIQWVCRYEDSLIQPIRPVIDINTGKFASGNRI